MRTSITDLRTSITDIALRDPQDIERTEQDGDETVISLDSDILFEFDKAEISAAAAAKIEELVADIPDGTALSIGGHTDSLGSDARNNPLSEERAEAVAAVLRSARPDLSLTVEGFGSSQPVADNTRGGEDNPEGRALNRRVEIRYAG